MKVIDDTASLAVALLVTSGHKMCEADKSLCTQVAGAHMYDVDVDEAVYNTWCNQIALLAGIFSDTTKAEDTSNGGSNTEITNEGE